MYEKTASRIRNIFTLNGFTDDVIDRIKRKVEQGVRNACKSENEDKINVYWFIPFIQEDSKELQSEIEKLNRHLQNSEIKVAYRTSKLKDS